MEPGAKSGENVRFVEMVGCADDDGIERFVAQHVRHVVEGVGHAEPVGDGSCLGHVGVADGHDLDVLHLAQRGKVRHLNDGTATNDAYPQRIAHVPSSRQYTRSMRVPG